MQYYIIINEKQAGPYEKHQLLATGLDKNTPVWHEGLSGWMPASTLRELDDLFNPTYTYPAASTQQDNYYAMLPSGQTGPASLKELIRLGVNAQTPIWKDGMQSWQAASTLPEYHQALAEINRISHQAYQSPGTQPPVYNINMSPGYNPYYNNNQYVPHTNWMPLAIVATILGLLCSCIGAIFGIIGIIQANKANTSYAQGDTAQGDSANSTARIMTLISFAVAAVGIVGLVFLGLFN